MTDYNTFGQVARMARLDAELSLRDAARKLKNPATSDPISPSYISKIERDHCEPPSANLIRQMAALYNIAPELLLQYAKIRTTEFLGEELQNNPEKLNLYRLTQDMSPEEIRAIIGKLMEGLPPEEQENLKAKFNTEFPREQRRRHMFAPRIKPKYLSRLVIRQIAIRVLAKFRITLATYKPCTPIEWIIERTRDVDLVPSDGPAMISSNGSPVVLGLTHWDNAGLRKVIEINEDLYDSDRTIDKYRLNFTLAHELWHAIEHLDLVGKKNRRETSIMYRAVAPSLALQASNKGPRKLKTDEDWQEWQADTFAAEILMPHWHVESEIQHRFGAPYLMCPRGMDSLEYASLVAEGRFSTGEQSQKSLNETYAVSRQAMAIRLTSLGLVRDDPN